LHLRQSAIAAVRNRLQGSSDGHPTDAALGIPE
jgi:hypothetical protein